MAYLPVDLDYSLLAWNDAQKLSYDPSLFLPQQNRRSLIRRDHVDIRSWNPPPCTDFIYPLTDNSAAAMNYAVQNALYLPQTQPVYSSGIYHGAQHHHAYQLPQHNTHQQTYSVHHAQPQPVVYGTELSPNDNCTPGSSGEVCNPQLVNGISPLEGQPSNGEGSNDSPNVPQASDVQEPIPYGDEYGESEIESVEEDEDYVGSDDEFFPSSSRKNQRDGKRDSIFGYNARPYFM